VVDVVRQLRGTLVAEGSLCTRAHTAIALSRPGASSIDDDDEAWARALQAALGEDCLETWSVHVAAGGWITTVVDPPFGEVPPTPHLPAPPAELLDRSWLADHN
jgi:hypothetical protein